jgi:MtN3 and saliva related transmembrane protein
MKQFVAVVFGLGLVCNALLFVPQGIGIVHGCYQHDRSLILGMAASLITCGTVTFLTIYYRLRRS